MLIGAPDPVIQSLSRYIVNTWGLVMSHTEKKGRPDIDQAIMAPFGNSSLS
jgi:hypothetical protein